MTKPAAKTRTNRPMMTTSAPLRSPLDAVLSLLRRKYVAKLKTAAKMRAMKPRRVIMPNFDVDGIALSNVSHTSVARSCTRLMSQMNARIGGKYPTDSVFEYIIDGRFV